MSNVYCIIIIECITTRVPRASVWKYTPVAETQQRKEKTIKRIGKEGGNGVEGGIEGPRGRGEGKGPSLLCKLPLIRTLFEKSFNKGKPNNASLKEAGFQFHK